MTMRKSTCLDKKGAIPNEKSGYIENIRKLLTANFKRYIKDSKDKALADIAALAGSKRAEKHPDFISLIVAAVRDSVKCQKDDKKKEIKINAALVNKCLTEAIKGFSVKWSTEEDAEITALFSGNR